MSDDRFAPTPALAGLLPDATPWKTFPDTRVDYRVLRRHAGTAGGITLLLRFAPGADYAAHEHPGGEEYYVLEGTLRDGGRDWPAGSYVWHPPGSVHRPSSREGCVVFVHLPAAVVVRGT